jgi:hypothetical protein
MSSEQFKVLCARFLSRADAALLDLCSLDPDPLAPGQTEEEAVSQGASPRPASPAFLGAWWEWERALRLNLARYRAQRIRREGGAPVGAPEYPADAASAAKAAVALESPLEAEFFLDRARWNAIEALQGLHYFSVNTIYAYLLKLRLMERRALFKIEEGFAEYKGLYAAIMQVELGEPK